MQKYIILSILLFLFCANTAWAQEPEWELFAPGVSGPIAVDPTDSDIIYIFSTVSGMKGPWKTTDGGLTWNLYKEGWFMGWPKAVWIDPSNTDVIFVSGGPFVGIQKSIDGGQTWIRADYGFRVDHHGYEISDIVFDKKRSVFYAADDGTFGGIFKSTDGVNWQQINFSPSLFNPTGLVVDEATGMIYVSTWNGVWKGTDSSGVWNWVRINNGLNIDPDIIWDITKVEESNTLYIATFFGIYKSVNLGESWFSVNDSITGNLSFRGGVVVSQNDTNTIFAGAEGTFPDSIGGVYMSRDGGDSWRLYNYGLPDSALDFSAKYMFLDSRTNILYSSITLILSGLSGGTRAEYHTYRLRNAVLTSVKERETNVPLSYALEQNYPNPFNPTTMISYQIEDRGFVNLVVYNSIGQEVAILENRQREKGLHNVIFNASNLPSGIYIYRLQVNTPDGKGNYVKAKKMLLLR